MRMDQGGPRSSSNSVDKRLTSVHHWSSELRWLLKSQEDMGLLVSEDLNPFHLEVKSKATKCITSISMSPSEKPLGVPLVPGAQSTDPPTNLLLASLPPCVSNTDWI